MSKTTQEQAAQALHAAEQKAAQEQAQAIAALNSDEGKAAHAASIASAPAQEDEVSATEAPVTQGALGVEALASAVGATQKDVRRWLRAQTREALGKAQAADVLPGKGGRYAFTDEQISALALAYGASKAQKGTLAPAAAILAALAPVASEAPSA